LRCPGERGKACARRGGLAVTLAISICALAIAGIGLCRWAPGLPMLQHASVQAVYLLLAAGFAAGGLLLLLVPGLGPFLQLDHEGVRGWYGRHYPGAFTPRAVVPRVDA
jgi:hypothetical protein